MKAWVYLVALFATVAVAVGSAADWPGYLGPKRDYTSGEKGLLRTWPKEGPKVLWTVPVGIGYGGPAISRGRVYLLDRDDAVGDRLRVFDLSTGKELWSYSYDAAGKFDHPGSRTVPIVDGDLVYTFGPLGDLHAVNVNTQKPAWRKNVWTDFGGGARLPAMRMPPQGGARGPGGPGGMPPGGMPPGGMPPGGMPPGGPGGQPTARDAQYPTWGLTQNPLVYRNLLIVASQTAQAGVVAFDKLTGELKWKSEPLSGGVGYSSPSIAKIGGSDHLVMITASTGMGRNAAGGSTNGLDPLTGRVLWTYTGWQCRNPIPHAVDGGDGRVLITGAYGAGAALIQVAKAADGSYGVTELFKTADFGSHTQPPLVHRDHFWVSYTVNERADGLVCMTLDGKIRWKTGEEPPFNKGGMVLADGLLIATDGNKALYLIDPDPAGFKPLATAELLDPGENWAPIALSDGKLLIRDQKQMKAVQVAQGK